jgi:hypothetical protein
MFSFPFVFQFRIVGNFSGFLFECAFHFVESTFDLIFSAVVIFLLCPRKVCITAFSGLRSL